MRKLLVERGLSVLRYRLPSAVAGGFAISILAVVLALTLDVSAHHGTTFFSRDRADMVTVQGRVTRFDLQSPHSYLYAVSSAGVKWMWKFRSPASARKRSAKPPNWLHSSGRRAEARRR